VRSREWSVAVLVVLVAAVVVAVLVVRAAAAPGGINRTRRVRAPRPPLGGPSRPGVGPDDDPEFLRELERRTRRDDSPA
jgi:hypothetical protein